MKNRSILLFLTVAIFSFLACNGPKNNDATLKRAAALQLEAVEKAQQLMPVLENLRNLHGSIMVQGRALTPEEQEFLDASGSLMDRYGEWRKEALKIPGYEEQLLPIEDPQHPPKLAGTMGAQEVLQAQKEWKAEIMAIGETAGELQKFQG